MSTKRNRAKCKNCEEVIESKFRHDFQSCSCFKATEGARGVAIDGGQDYSRRVGDPNDIIEVNNGY